MRISKTKSGVLLFAILLTAYFQFFYNENVDSGQPSEILGALDLMAHQRAYPGNIILGGKFYSEYRSSLRKMKKAASEDSWKLLGPYNQGGRTNAIVVDPNNPNIVFAGSASGGLWKMIYYNDDNYTWERIDTGYPVLGVNAIAIDPRDSNVMFIGTGEVYGYQNSNGGLHIRTTRGSYGIGLLKTIDGGVNWTKSIDWTYSMQRGILAIDIDPENPDIIYAGTTEGVYKSTDSGETWTLKNSTVMAVDIEINPQNTDMIFVSFGNFDTDGNGIYRSDDAGDSWIKLSGGLPEKWTGKTMIDVYENEPNIIYADAADMFSGIGLYKSEDYGTTWTLLSNMGYSGGQGWFSHYVRVNPVDNNKIFLAGVVHGISEDGGKLFYTRPKQNMHLDNHAFANHPSNPDIIYFATDGGVYRTQDGGWIISPLNKGYVTAQFYPGFSCSSTDSNLAIGGMQDNGVMTYRGNPDWIREGFADGNYAFIDPNDDNVLYASNQRMHIYKSSNNGLDWNWINFSINDLITNVAFIAPSLLVDSDIMYAGSDKLFKTVNGGETWFATNNDKPLNGNSIISIGSPGTNPELIYVATVPHTGIRSEIFKSENGGDSWINVTGNLPDRYYTDIYVNPVTYDAHVVLSGFGTSHLFVTEDDGLTWKDIDNGNLPDIPGNAIIGDHENDNILYYGNDLGVYVSTDNGHSWSDFKDGMTNAAIVMDLTISRSNRNIIAATHGNGVYTRPLIKKIQTDIDDDPGMHIPENMELYQNYPNPFNPETLIKFKIERTQHVNLTIFSVSGAKIKTIHSGRLPAGTHKFKWDGTDSSGKRVASGPYLYRLKAGSRSIAKRMILVK